MTINVRTQINTKVKDTHVRTNFQSTMPLNSFRTILSISYKQKHEHVAHH